MKENSYHDFFLSLNQVFFSIEQKLIISSHRSESTMAKVLLPNYTTIIPPNLNKTYVKL